MPESLSLSSIRDPLCTKCSMSASSEAGTCIVSKGPIGAEVLIVTKYHPSTWAKNEMDKYLDEAGVTKSRAYTGVIKCKSENEPTKTDIRACSEYLRKEIVAIGPKVVLAVGNEALLALTGRVGIMKYRARAEHHRIDDSLEVVIFPTISPAMVRRNPGQRVGFVADLEYVKRLLAGETSPTPPPERMRVVMTPGGLRALVDALKASHGVSYDIETNKFSEHDADSVIASISFTMWGPDFTNPEVWGLPLAHPESPFVGRWKETLLEIKEALQSRKSIIAHNGKFDGRWMSQFGSPLRLTFDTMLAAHILNENRPKGLKPLAQALLGAVPWDIDATRVMERPLAEVMKYNGLDTWYTAHLYRLFLKELKEQPRLGALFVKLMMPAANDFTEIERKGIWIDRERLDSRAKITDDILRDIDDRLKAMLPDRSEWPDHLQKSEINFNPSHFSRWFLFEHLGQPVYARGKTGAPSMAEDVIERLYADNPDNEALKLMIERTKWQKYSSSFFSAYQELVDDNDHIHTTFKLTGTVTGRLSSGKGDEEKVSGRVPNRGVNLQQVPRDPFVRGLFGAPPGWFFMECDYSQVELRLAADSAGEKTMLHLYNTGQDIHTTMARRMVGRSEVGDEERKKAKAVNFGFLYGMGWKTFIDTAWKNYGLVVSEYESKAFRKAFFDEFSMLTEWHRRQRRLAAKYKRVESPIGRVRHLPDIDSEDESVRGEAQRQAINSPIQSFASDMCILSLIQLNRSFRRQGLQARSVGTVHDAINFVVPHDEATRVVPLVRQVMENLPLERLFGTRLKVPIIADVKLGRYWGDSIKVPNNVSESPLLLESFIKEHSDELGM